MRNSTRRLILIAGMCGLVAVAADILSHQSHLTLARPAGVILTDGRAAVHEEIERLESTIPAGEPGHEELWRAYLQVFETAHAQGHRDVAVRVLYDAYGAALESRSWESMIAVGDAFMSIGRAPGSRAGARMNARQAYLSALIRARRSRSVDGALRAAAAFEDIDDRDVVEQCLYVAALLAAGDADAQRKVQDARERWVAQQLTQES